MGRVRITRPFVLLALAAVLAPRVEASRTGAWERNPPAAVVLAKADAASALAALAPAADADVEAAEPPLFDLGEVVLVDRELEHEDRLSLGSLSLLGPAPLRGPPSSYPETRVGGFELLPPFAVGASPRLSLWGRQACGFSCREVASDSRYDPWGLAGTPARAPVVPPRSVRRTSDPPRRSWRSPESEGRAPRSEVQPLEPIQLHPPYLSGDDFTAIIWAQNQLPEPETTLGAPPEFRGFILTEEELDSPYLTQLRSADPNSDEYHQLYALHLSWLDDKRSGGFGPGPTRAKLRHAHYAAGAGDDALYARGSFRKKVVEGAAEGAPRNAEGEMLCPTCRRVMPEQIVVETKRGPVVRRGFDLDHFPETWAERVRRMMTRPSPPTRKEVLDEYNRWLRAQCPECNQGHQFEGVPGLTEVPQ
jgi:hypothetical protein